MWLFVILVSILEGDITKEKYFFFWKLPKRKINFRKKRDNSNESMKRNRDLKILEKKSILKKKCSKRFENNTISSYLNVNFHKIRFEILSTAPNSIIENKKIDGHLETNTIIYF